jgi:hypothetical protein
MKRLPLAGFDHHALERRKVGVLKEDIIRLTDRLRT